MSGKKRNLFCIVLLLVLICTGCAKKTEISKSEAFSADQFRTNKCKFCMERGLFE